MNLHFEVLQLSDYASLEYRLSSGVNTKGDTVKNLGQLKTIGKECITTKNTRHF